MKRKTLLILLAAIFTQLTTISATAAEKKLAVEGRTWWYKSEQRIVGNTQEYGIRIGEEVTIDGERWNKVKLHMYTAPHLSDIEGTIVNDTVTFAYMKDDGCSITLRGTDEAPERMIESLYFYLFLQEGYYSTYKFGEIGDMAKFGSERFKETYVIEDIDTIENSGHSYKLYKARFTDDPTADYNFILKNEPFDFIEGIGHPSNLFLFPFLGGSNSMIGWQEPELAYVTEGDDNHVIYEAAGGKKLWELAGIEAVTVDSDNAQPEWFTLQGVKIDEPTATGVYIRRTGSRSEKVVVK